MLSWTGVKPKYTREQLGWKISSKRAVDTNGRRSHGTWRIDDDDNFSTQEFWKRINEVLASWNLNYFLNPPAHAGPRFMDPGTGSQRLPTLLLLGRPYGVTGGLIKCSWCFFFRRQISELPRPIAAKLCHMIGTCVSFINWLQKFGELSPLKNWGPKTCKISVDFIQQ